ncbi:MAG: PhnD/SsuA/transferrin family substrate-binding protein [Hoeflea sp.]|uniref:phosphate/phosphite/phosphonate ABC transporter substrate-binding protein n=1 Tax=Hoeflea sp. TaxID=1940281 RepID=UPI001D9EDB66|nr:PhnD/SsuA/transferrin family substrate-binding protein [Hoeflea sp.]MBU4531647.1 PhnD/SsuA/transferrin family substrate-binding protein [Alphaproteobacteria bacterium]MBU4544504.1 PhnD/SsuA/transferrin family substrate-binding protein [Alphaproteobacteria bacterium]MBU4552735.1 PhnD/SsuA/transferrin family substrate-binding protein [Alphaproteobacteria bacterium]MBV1724923.1 PhnD/SsuA/transferrin family substrate-binding protein [Hoeflea sp.]MBV1760943.1 PhnD/SsuA/transferrin family substra
MGVIMASGARADYRETVPVLRIGVVEAHLAATPPAKLDAVRLAFASALRIPVEIIRMGSYAALIDAHASGRVGYAIHSARSFAATDAVCGCVRAFRSPVAGDGSTGFRSVLVVRDSVNKQVSDLKVAYSREDSVSGWQIPNQAMKTGGLDSPQLVRAGSVASVIALYQAGEVDGFFGWIPDRPGDTGSGLTELFGGWNQSAIEGSAPLRMLWSSQRIPYGPHAVLRTLPDDLVEALGAFLDQMPSSAPGLLDILEPVYGGGYVTPDPEDYRNIRGLVEVLPSGDAAALPTR